MIVPFVLYHRGESGSQSDGEWIHGSGVPAIFTMATLKATLTVPIFFDLYGRNEESGIDS